MNRTMIRDDYQDKMSRTGDSDAARLRYLAHHLSPAERSVLNIGVDNGYLERMIHAGRDVYSLDPSEAAIRALRIDLGMDAGHAKVGYSQAIPFPDVTFDVVIMAEVMEHLEDDVIAATLREITRVLKPGGRYLGTVPADENLGARQTVCPNCGESFHLVGHVQSFSKERLSTLLRRDFQHVTVRHVFLVGWRTLNWKGRAKWLLKKALVHLGVKGSGQDLYFEAARGS